MIVQQFLIILKNKPKFLADFTSFLLKPMHSKNWLARQKKDTFVKQAQEAGYSSRASFKLLQIQQQDQLIKPEMCVMDLGAAPGGWSQVLADIIKHKSAGDQSKDQGKGKGKGKIVALDKLPIASIAGVDFIQGDFTEEHTLNLLKNYLSQQKVQWFDLVLSDMSPNISGIKLVDQCESIYLAELALDFCLKYLKVGGDFLVKVFEGRELAEYKLNLKQHFNKVLVRKPEASRTQSKEIYLLARSKQNLN